jgi:hypothetical protein
MEVQSYGPDYSSTLHGCGCRVAKMLVRILVNLIPGTSSRSLSLHRRRSRIQWPIFVSETTQKDHPKIGHFFLLLLVSRYLRVSARDCSVMLVSLCGVRSKRNSRVVCTYLKSLSFLVLLFTLSSYYRGTIYYLSCVNVLLRRVMWE